MYAMKHNVTGLFIAFMLSSIFSEVCTAQHNLLGKSQEFIEGLYKYDPEFYFEKDTINDDKLLLTCKTSEVYPYHTYEVDLTRDKCMSYGYVSKNPDILKSYFEILGFIGKVVQSEQNSANLVYAVDLENRTVYYSIRRPYANSSIITRQNVFYILVTEDQRQAGVVKKPN